MEGKIGWVPIWVKGKQKEEGRPRKKEISKETWTHTTTIPTSWNLIKCHLEQQRMNQNTKSYLDWRWTNITLTGNPPNKCLPNLWVFEPVWGNFTKKTNNHIAMLLKISPAWCAKSSDSGSGDLGPNSNSTPTCCDRWTISSLLWASVSLFVKQQGSD